MKNEAFLEIGALRNTVEELQEQVTSDQTMNEKFQRINRDNITNLSAKVSDQASTQRRLMTMMEVHSLKLNATGKYQQNSPWQLTSDVDKYPMLRSASNHIFIFLVCQKC